MIAISVKFHPKKQQLTFFPQKKNSVRDPQNGRSGDFETEAGNRKFFFQ